MKVMDDPFKVVKELWGRVVEYQDPVVDAYDWEEYFPVIDPVTESAVTPLHLCMGI